MISHCKMLQHSIKPKKHALSKSPANAKKPAQKGALRTFVAGSEKRIFEAKSERVSVLTQFPVAYLKIESIPLGTFQLDKLRAKLGPHRLA